jgi:hypothetical protein
MTLKIQFANIGKEGRLGNAMFQYAALKALCLEKNEICYLPHDIDKREFDGQICLLNYFKHTAVLSTQKEEEAFNGISYRFKEEEDSYLNLPLPVNLEGHPESELFFKKYKSEIKKEFEFINHIENISIQYIEDLRKKQCKPVEIVGIHVRRGDRNNYYAWDKWYRVYIEYIVTNMFPEDKYIFLCFTGGNTTPGNSNTEEITWCKENIKIDAPLFFCDVNDTIKDLAIMTKCDHMILSSRSTLAWWGAYLNKNKEKRVIVPKAVPYFPTEASQYFPPVEFNSSVFWSDEFIMV